jgi:putative flippase GtrA
MSRQFGAFLITGGIAACVNFGSRILYNRWMEFSAAVIMAYVTGMVTAFVLARLFVFEPGRQSLQRSATLFALVNLVAVAQTLVISLGLAYYVLPALGVAQGVKEIAHGVGITVPVFTSYLGHKRWSFQ